MNCWDYSKKKKKIKKDRNQTWYRGAFNPLRAKPTKWSSTAIADKLLECVWPFWGLGAWRVNKILSKIYDEGFFVKIVNNIKLPAMFARSSIVDVWLDPKYASEEQRAQNWQCKRKWSKSINSGTLKPIELCSENRRTNLKGHMTFIWHPRHHMNVL